MIIIIVQVCNYSFYEKNIFNQILITFHKICTIYHRNTTIYIKASKQWSQQSKIAKIHRLIYMQNFEISTSIRTELSKRPITKHARTQHREGPPDSLFDFWSVCRAYRASWLLTLALCVKNNTGLGVECLRDGVKWPRSHCAHGVGERGVPSWASCRFHIRTIVSIVTRIELGSRSGGKSEICVWISYQRSLFSTFERRFFSVEILTGYAYFRVWFNFVCIDCDSEKCDFFYMFSLCFDAHFWVYLLSFVGFRTFCTTKLSQHNERYRFEINGYPCKLSTKCQNITAVSFREIYLESMHIEFFVSA